MTGSDTPPKDENPNTTVGKDLPAPRQNEDAFFAEAAEFRGALNKLSQEEPQMASMVMGMMGSEMLGNPLHQKMDAGHITQLLDLAQKHDEREFELRKQTLLDAQDGRKGDRRYLFAAFVIVTSLFIALLIIFQDQPEILIPSLTGLGGLISGFIGGWGLGKRRED